MYKTFIYSNLFLLLLSGHSFAQTYARTVLKLDATTGSFNNPMPYDEAFTIAGDVNGRKNVTYVSYTYKLTSDTHKGLILPGWQSGDAMTRVNADGTTFILPCEGVVANRDYKFSFLFYSAFGDDKLRQDIKTIIGNKLTAFFKGNEFNYTEADLQGLKADINDGLHTLLAGKTAYQIKKVDHKDKAVPVDLTGDLFTFQKFQQDILNYANNIKGPIDNYPRRTNDLRGRLKAFFQGNDLREFLTLVADTHRMTPAGMRFIRQTIDTTDARFKSFAIKDFTPSLREMLDTRYGDNVPIFMDHNVSFANFTFIPAKRVDRAFFLFLLHYLTALRQIHFINPAAAAPYYVMLTHAIDDLGDWLKEMDTLFAAYDAEDAFIKNMTDITANYLIADKFEIVNQVDADLFCNNSPYISLDGGIGYNPGFKSFFSHYGVNFYFLPIKKRVPLKTYKSNFWLYVLKSTSLSVGIINNYFNNDVDKSKERHVSLLGGNSDLLVGIGHRINRAVKINIGTALYFRKNIDPQIASKTLEGKFVASLSLDVDVIGAFSNIGKALSITP